MDKKYYDTYPPHFAVWCNNNNKHIVETSENGRRVFQAVENPAPEIVESVENE